MATENPKPTAVAAAAPKKDKKPGTGKKNGRAVHIPVGPEMEAQMKALTKDKGIPQNTVNKAVRAEYEAAFAAANPTPNAADMVKKFMFGQ